MRNTLAKQRKKLQVYVTQLKGIKNYLEHML
jgi:hypothetical protein